MCKFIDKYSEEFQESFPTVECMNNLLHLYSKEEMECENHFFTQEEKSCDCYRDISKAIKIDFKANEDFHLQMIKKLTHFMIKVIINLSFKERQRWKSKIKLKTIYSDFKKAYNYINIPDNFMKPIKASKEIIDFCNTFISNSMPSIVEITTYIIKYVKENNLYNPENKRQIIPDEKLITLFKLENNQPISFFNLQKYISQHITKDYLPIESFKEMIPDILIHIPFEESNPFKKFKNLSSQLGFDEALKEIMFYSYHKLLHQAYEDEMYIMDEVIADFGFGFSDDADKTQFFFEEFKFKDILSEIKHFLISERIKNTPFYNKENRGYITLRNELYDILKETSFGNNGYDLCKYLTGYVY